MLGWLTFHMIKKNWDMGGGGGGWGIKDTCWFWFATGVSGASDKHLIEICVSKQLAYIKTEECPSYSKWTLVCVITKAQYM